MILITDDQVTSFLDHRILSRKLFNNETMKHETGLNPWRWPKGSRLWGRECLIGSEQRDSLI